VSFLSSSIAGFLTELESSKPTPGGGSAAALSGALGAALLHMVLQITLKKTEDQDKRGEITRTAENIKGYLDRLGGLIDEDASAFDAVMSAFKLPKGNDEQKKARRGAIQEGFKGAAQVPMRTAKACDELAKLSVYVAEHGEANAISDVGTAAGMLNAGFSGARLNILINLSAIKDEGFVGQLSSELKEMEDTISKELENTNSFVERRME